MLWRNKTRSEEAKLERLASSNIRKEEERIDSQKLAKLHSKLEIYNSVDSVE